MVVVQMFLYLETGEDDKCVVKFLDLHTISHSIQHYIMVETWNTVPPSSLSIAGLRCTGLIVVVDGFR